MFIVFVGCALVPILLFTAYSLVRVGNQLRDQADRQLHRSVKTTGMTLVERLDLAQQDRRIAGEVLRNVDPADIESTPPQSGATDDEVGSALVDRLDVNLAARLAERFIDVKVRHRSGLESRVLGASFYGPELTTGDWALLDEGHPLVRTLPDLGGASRVAMILPNGESGEVIVGRVSPAFLWPSEGSATLTTMRICYDPEGSVLFTSGIDGEIPDLAPQVLTGENSGRFTWRNEGETWLGRHWRLFMRFQYEEEWIIVETAPESEVLAPVTEFRVVFVLISILSLAFVLILSSMQIRKQLVPIETLQAATRRIAQERFDERVRLETGDEFEELGESFNVMAAELQRNLRMRRSIIDLGIELTAEGNRGNLLQVLLLGTRRVLGCDASAAVVLSNENTVEACVVQVGTETRTLARNELEGVLTADRLEDRHAVQSAIGRPVRELLALELRDHEGDRIGTLYAIDPRSEDGDPVTFSVETSQLGRLLAAQASAALTQTRLLEGFKDLFDGLSNLIATAIDEKSPYTYGHCQRVPIATMILADALHRTEEGMYADFKMTPEQRYELEVAALLHDCGKVTTPVHVVDKATKLETIFDRIHLVAMRFEAVAMERRVDRLERQLRGEAVSDPEAERLFEAQLREDFEFLARSNTGGEFLPQEAKDRIREIGHRYHHVDLHGERKPILSEDEIENLSISRGTLNDAERKIIQDHVVSSIKMLEMLPYPKNLARVPLIAGAHHERMDGKGYPNGIHIGELPLEARVLALADVFEALTAKDRPYKDGKTLSEALRIMGFMKKEGHLDPDLFDFFLTEGVYLEYANAYLSPNQIDEVDIASLPGCENLARRDAA
ncbi:MAG: HD domain-containing phosphohydrolase [Candidatus Eisenbacteria bacterium]